MRVAAFAPLPPPPPVSPDAGRGRASERRPNAMSNGGDCHQVREVLADFPSPPSASCRLLVASGVRREERGPRISTGDEGSGVEHGWILPFLPTTNRARPTTGGDPSSPLIGRNSFQSIFHAVRLVRIARRVNPWSRFRPSASPLPATRPSSPTRRRDSGGPDRPFSILR